MGYISKKAMISALMYARGNISAAARDLGITPSAFRHRIKSRPYLQELIEELREELLDKAEEGLYQQVEKRNIAAIIFTLKTLGKSRGYIETQKVQIKIDKPLREMTDEELDELSNTVHRRGASRVTN